MSRKNIVIIIAGPSGAGKTRLTDSLAREIDGIPLHLDDLFFGHHYKNYDNPLMIAKSAGIIARRISDFLNKPIVADFIFYKKELRDAFRFDIGIVMKTGRDMAAFEDIGFHLEVFRKDCELAAKEIKVLLNFL